MQVPSSTSHITILALLNPIKSAVFRLDYFAAQKGYFSKPCKTAWITFRHRRFFEAL